MPPAGTIIPKTRAVSLLLAACLTMLAICSLLALHAAWRWPLVGDAALIRYIVFLLHSGRTPYKDVIDLNLPGSYLLEALAMKCFGWDAIGLRCYDAFLSLTFCALAWLLPTTPLTSNPFTSNLSKTQVPPTPSSIPQDRLACLGGGLLFLLIHLQDGLTETGQRDLALAVLLLAAIVVLSLSMRQPRIALCNFELLIGLTLTVKPTLWPMALLPLALPHLRRASNRWVTFSTALTGLTLPPAIVLGWLLHTGSLAAFLHMTASIGLLHGQLGRHTLGFLLAHCTAPVAPLFLLWLIVLAVARSSPSSSSAAKASRILRVPLLAKDPTRQLLLAASLCGLLSYLEQGKALSYQRYPFLGLALVLIALDLTRAANLRHKTTRITALLAIATATLWFAPRFTASVRSFDTTQPFEDHLAHSLRTLPGPVQCLDTFGGCIDTLYQTRTLQATGFLYDCYLFTPPSPTRDRYREDFLRSFNAAHLRTVVLTNQPCFDPAKNYDRLTTWPAFQQQLDRDYRLQTEWHTDTLYRWWNRPEHPIAYRLYTLR